NTHHSRTTSRSTSTTRRSPSPRTGKSQVDAWETTYLHVLRGEDPVFEWVSGTGARPTLQALPQELRETFETEFRARLRRAYPDEGQGVVLPFRRLFAVARTAG
ncbi:trans-aconitate methyltransferase, partial [Brachybacterium tyrofermentans]